MANLRVERSDGVVTFTLDRPERKNALGPDDWRALAAACAEVAARSEDRVVVVTGAGNDFCAGADLGALPDGRPLVETMRDVAEAARALRALPKPTIARVDGVAVGAGCNLALCCDLVAASDRARFAEIFPRRGLSVDFGGSWLLPRLVGLQRAKQLVLLGDIVDAPTAASYGLVTEVVAAEQLDRLVTAWATRLASGPPVALALSKELLDAAWGSSFEQALAAEGHAQAVSVATEDAREGFAAFRERREPVFKGR